MPDVVFMNKAVVTAFLMLLPPPYFVRIEYKGGSKNSVFRVLLF